MRAGRLTQFAEIYRPGEARNERGATTTKHTLVGRCWIGVALPRRTLAQYGAGEVSAGTMELSAHGATPIAMRDVVKITAGTESGTLWRVVTAHRPGNGELLGTVVPYTEPLEVV